MPVFVHITSENTARKVQRAGIWPLKWTRRSPRGVFAMPVTPDFQITHQWVRELKQWGGGMMVGVYFRVPDAEPVWVGRYNEENRQMTAAQATAHVMAQTTMTGVEVVIPCRILPKEIMRIRRLPQVVGWRHYPDAHGKRPWACECCQKGGYGSRKIRENMQDKQVNSVRYGPVYPVGDAAAKCTRTLSARP